MGKVFVTGALGNVGSYLVEYGLSIGLDIKVGGRDLKALSGKFGTKVEICKFDFLDSSTFSNALENVDRVFILRPPQLGNPMDLKPFIERLKEIKDIKLVSFLSLIGIEKNPFPPHYKIEKYIEDAKLPYCHIRPSFFMQNINGIHSFEIRHFNNLVVPVGKSKTSFIDVKDIGELLAKIFKDYEKHQQKAYSITGKEAIDYYEVARILSEELNRKITYSNPKMLFAKKYWTKVRGIDKNYATIMSMLYLMTRLGTAKKVTQDFYGIMNKQPTSFRDFVKNNLKSWE